MTHPYPKSPSEIEIDAYASYLVDDAKLTSTERNGGKLLAIGFGLYSAAAVTLAATGIYAQLHPSVFAMTVVASMSALVLGYFKLKSIRAFVTRLGPFGLASFHIWRVPAALAFLYYGWQGWLPDIFVNLAGWGDMIAGILAAGLLLLPATLSRIKAFHIVGFADFIVAVGTGLTLQLLNDPLMVNITQLPIAFIPLIGVPLSGASHIAAFHVMASRKDDG